MYFIFALFLDRDDDIDLRMRSIEIILTQLIRLHPPLLFLWLSLRLHCDGDGDGEVSPDHTAEPGVTASAASLALALAQPPFQPARLDTFSYPARPWMLLFFSA